MSTTLQGKYWGFCDCQSLAILVVSHCKILVIVHRNIANWLSRDQELIGSYLLTLSEQISRSSPRN